MNGEQTVAEVSGLLSKKVNMSCGINQENLQQHGEGEE